VSRIDIKTPGFAAWLDQRGGPSSEPVQVRCMKLAGEASLKTEVERLHAARSALIKAYLIQEHGLAPDRVIVREATPEDKLAASGQPYFQMVYGVEEGETP
jgi:hypothetical protein